MTTCCVHMLDTRRSGKRERKRISRANLSSAPQNSQVTLGPGVWQRASARARE